jgi:hypothetical protein
VKIDRLVEALRWVETERNREREQAATWWYQKPILTLF